MFVQAGKLEYLCANSERLYFGVLSLIYQAVIKRRKILDLVLLFTRISPLECAFMIEIVNFSSLLCVGAALFVDDFTDK